MAYQRKNVSFALVSVLLLIDFAKADAASCALVVGCHALFTLAVGGVSVFV